MRKFCVIMLLAVIATINAWYLTSKAFGRIGGATFCDINSRRSCGNVVSNPAALVGPLPFPAIALVVYPVLFVLALLGKHSSKPKNYYTALSRLSLWGILFNGYFVGVEAFVIKAFCPLCLLCSGIIITIFILSLLGRNSKKIHHS